MKMLLTVGLRAKALFTELLGLTVITLLCFTSCGPAYEKPNCDNVSDLYLRQSVGRAAVNGAINRVEIYCDASVPMRNYVKTPGAPSKTMYTRLLDFIGVNPWDPAQIQFFQFGEGEPAPIAGDRSRGMTLPANSRDFYTAKWTYLGELIRHIRSRAKAGDQTVHIVITDFVQASPTTTNAPERSQWTYVANQIREFQRAGGWQLIALRSRYEGTHFPESGGPPFPVPGVANRPFYLMIFAPTDALADQAAQKLLSGEGTEEWSGGAVRFRPRQQLGEIVWLDNAAVADQRSFFPISNLCDGRYADYVWKDITKFRQPQVVRQLLRVETSEPDECFIQINNPSLTMKFTCYRWLGARDTLTAWGDTVAVDQPLMSLRVHEQDTAMQRYEKRFWNECTLKAARGMTAGSHYVYQFTIKSDPERLRLPAWVAHWSCDDDNDPSNIGRTLNLKRILGAVMRNTNEDEPLLTGALVMEGRD